MSHILSILTTWRNVALNYLLPSKLTQPKGGKLLHVFYQDLFLFEIKSASTTEL